MSGPEAPIPPSKFQQKLAERRAQREAEEAAAKVTQEVETSSFVDGLMPEEVYEGKTDQDKELDRVIAGIGIVDAYNRWAGKKPAKPGSGQTEGIKVSCPKPEHPDNNPSAWLNTDKGTWFCGGCQEGGDVYDIAAIHFGYPRPQYKEGSTFHDLRRDMARSFGYTFAAVPGLTGTIMLPPDPQVQAAEEKAQAEQQEEENERIASVSRIDGPGDDDEPEFIFPTLEWRDVVAPETFLATYMECTSPDDVPEEYHFWNGLMAIGFAMGRDVTLYDGVPVYGNLFVCLMGNTGDGKSRSFSHFKRLIEKSLPHKWDDPNSKGVSVIRGVASAESLISAFSKPVVDPSTPSVISYYASVRGLVEYNELSSLTGRAGRAGNVLKPTLMDFYDMSKVVGTQSLTTGKKEAHEPYCSVFTTTQPRALRELLGQGDADSGFLNRWVFASGKQKRRLAIGGVPIDIDPAVKPLMELVGWIGFGKQLAWSTAAAERFTEFFDDILMPRKQADDSGMLTRIDLLMKKLILLLSANEHADVVPVSVVDKVIKMYPYLIAAYAIPSAQLGNTLMNECHEEIARHVKRLTELGKPPTQRELMQRLKRKKYPLDLIHKVLKYMTELGEIKPEAVNTGRVGRPAVRYSYVG